MRGSRNSSSSGPAPVNSWRRVRRAARTSRSDATPPDSARTAAATAAGSVSPPAAASRERTRSTRPTVGALIDAPRPACPVSRASSASTVPAAPASGPRGLPGARPASTARASPGSGRIATSRGTSSARAISSAAIPPGDGPRTTRRTLPPYSAEARGHPGRCGARADVGRDDQQRQVDGAERGDRRLGGVAGNVAHDGFARPSSGLEHGGDGGRVRAVRRPVAREQRQLARRRRR